MKRTLSILSFAGLLCLCLFALSPSASAAEVVDSGYCGGEGDGTNLTWTLTDDGVLTIAGEGEMGDYSSGEVPWYSQRSQIKALDFQGGVTTIGDYTFNGCDSLTSVEIPEGVTTIGFSAFSYCDNLTAVEIPEGVTTIGNSAFSHCSSLTAVEIPEGVTTIGKSAFWGCDSFTAVEIPEGVITIGDYAFYGCGRLTSVEIPEGVTTIGSSAFYNESLRIIFARGGAPETVNGVSPAIPLVYPQSANPWTEGWGAIPCPWDETVSSSAITLDLKNGSITLYEADGVTYCLQSGVAKATTRGVLVRQTDSGSASTANTITAAGGSCTVNISGLNISSQSAPIDVGPGVSLTLSLLGTNTLIGTGSAGICVPDDAALEIKGTGSVTATGGINAAGIGGSQNSSGGTITIAGGTVTATGGDWAAGIGGGRDCRVDSVTITGGTVTATGGRLFYGISAGIGGGYGGIGGTVTITGGTVACSGIGAENGVILDAVTISDKATVTNADGGNPDINEIIYIDTQPLTTAAHNGNIPVLSVAAHNHSGISYQWQVFSNGSSSWLNLEGQTSAQTTFPMSADLNGKYVRCQLTNGWGNVLYTDVVQVWTLAFSQQPVSVEANLNDMAFFHVESTCSNVAYQWQRSYDDGHSWVDVPGETYGTLAVNATLSESSAKYRCVITATNGDQLASDMVEIKLDAGALVTYTARYYQQNPDGQGYTLVNQQVLEGISGQTVTIPETSYEGFTENTQAGTLSGIVTGDSGLVLARYYDRNTYQITFQMNGGSVLPPLEARYGADITPPSNPSRFAYTFAGWYADEALTEEYTFTTMPLGGTTVYAKWTPVGADRGIEYKINGLAVRDISTFEVLDAIPNGKFLVEVSVTNLKATGTDTILLVQYTDQGQMLGMQYLYASTQAGQTVTFGASVDNTDGKIGKIKAMILPSLGSPVPLANAVEIM